MLKQLWTRFGGFEYISALSRFYLNIDIELTEELIIIPIYNWFIILSLAYRDSRYIMKFPNSVLLLFFFCCFF